LKKSQPRSEIRLTIENLVAEGFVMLGEFFDPQAELFVEDRLRPHWSQAGAIVFITFRTRDSIPKQVIELWERQ